MASLLTLPLIMLNMGGEMVYILAQRLDAQKVSGEKSQRVRGSSGFSFDRAHARTPMPRSIVHANSLSRLCNRVLESNANSVPRTGHARRSAQSV